MEDHGFCKGEKVNDPKNAMLGKILVQIRLQYNQIEENSNNLGICFLTFS